MNKKKNKNSKKHKEHKEIKLLVIGDLHGQLPTISFSNFDAIILHGDVCKDGGKEYIWRAMTWNANHPNAKKKKQWYDYCGKKKARAIINDNVSIGRKILEHLSTYQKPIFLVPGNWDYKTTDKKMQETALSKQDLYSILAKGLNRVHDCFRTHRSFKGFSIIGNGVMSAPERKGVPYGYEYWRQPLERHFKNAKLRRQPIIYLNHDVPYLCMDQITNKQSPAFGRHYGSKVARDLIVEYAPLLCIGGHIHEHYGTKRIGKTIVLNAGFGREKNTLITLKQGKVTRIEYATRPWSGNVNLQHSEKKLSRKR